MRCSGRLVPSFTVIVPPMGLGARRAMGFDDPTTGRRRVSHVVSFPVTCTQPDTNGRQWRYRALGRWHMPLVGTARGLQDLDSGERFADGMAVTALALG